MEWSIPLQKLEVSKISIGPFLQGVKPLVPVSYLDGQLHIPSLSILLPHCTVKQHDPQTGKLDISLAGNAPTLQKLLLLQKTLLHTVVSRQDAWFPNDTKTLQELEALFQPMIEGDVLHLYCPVTIQDKRSGAELIFVYQADGTRTHGVRPGHIRAGDSIRVAFRIQGISFHNHPLNNRWSGKFRFQHKIVAVFNSTAV